MFKKRRNTTCRICLRFGSKVEKNCKSLFEIHNNCSSILDNLSLVADIKIEENDGLPSKICGECLSELDAAINFKDKCERSNKLLHSVNEDEEKFNTLSSTELPIPIELVKKEDASEDDIQYEVEYYNDAENDSEIKSEFDQTDTALATEVKSELKSEESDVALATSETHKSDLKKSKAIDLKLKCDDCGGSFKSKCKLRVHWKKVHMKERLICNYCKRNFKSFITYHKHMKNRPNTCIVANETRIEGIGRSRVFNCKHCQYQTKSSHQLKFHINIHTGNRPFVCKLCSKGFTQYSALDSHKESVHKIIKKVITCQYCGQLVMGRQKIRKHLDKHTRSPVQCDICKKMYVSKQILVNHLKHHSGVKAYTCEKCGAAFYTSASLITHRHFAHSSERRYFKCDTCGFKVLKKASLKKHQIKHTNSNVACGVCGRFYPDAEELASHQKLHTKEKSVCFECNRIFCNERSLKRHKIETHKHKRNSSKKKPIKIKNYSASVIDCKDEKIEVEIIPLIQT